MIKVRHNYKGKETVYEYETSTMMVNTETRNKIKMMASKEGLSMKDFVHKLIDVYQG